jgi:hypothetical protein
MKRYEVLKKQRVMFFRGVIPYLEKAFEVNPKSCGWDIIKLL